MIDDKKPFQATPAATLEQHVMDARIAKSEAEWWASREIERLRARVEVLEQLARESLNVLTCNEEDDNDPGHWCCHCDNYVDRNGPHRNALRAALEAKP
jgi:hypothetical protein